MSRFLINNMANCLLPNDNHGMISGARPRILDRRPGMGPTTRTVLLALLALAAARPGLATTRYYTLSGATAGVENGCPAWVLEDAPGGNGDDCSYDNGHPLAAGNAQWIGPVFSAGYYPAGGAPLLFTTPAAPAPVTDPVAVLPAGGTTGVPIHQGFLAIDDVGTVDGRDDVISGTIELDGFDRNVASSATTRIIESFGRIIHKLIRVRVNAATANAAGGFDYVVAVSGGAAGYPELLAGANDASDHFPSEIASQSSADAGDFPYWATRGLHGIAVLDGTGYTSGTVSSATVWDYGCQDGSPVPFAHDCDNAGIVWSGDGLASLTNVLLKLSTSSTGLITSAQAVLVQESENSPTLNGNDTWVATTLDFSGSETDLPVAFDDRSILVYFVTPGGATTVDVLANDLPGVPPDTVTIESGPAQGTASVISNRIQYLRGSTPEGTQEITYKLTDSAGQSSTGKVQIVITDQILCAADTATTTLDTPVTVDVLANDSGFDIPPVVLTIATPPKSGTAVVNPDRTITFTPPAGKGGQYDMEYFLADGTNRPRTCNLTVKLPGTPQAVDDTASVLANGSIILSVLDNDLEVSDTPLALAITTSPQHGTATVDTSAAQPRIRYVPAAGYVGADSLAYTVTDVDGDVSNAATVNLTAVGPPQNDVPVCADDTAESNRDVATTIDVLANDTGLNAAPVAVTIDQVVPESFGTAVVNPDNTIKFTPPAGKGGTVRIFYTANEAVNNPVSCKATLKIDDQPVAVDNNVDAVNFGKTVSVGILNNDSGLSDTPITIEITAQPAHGTVTVCDSVSAQCPGFFEGSTPFVRYVYNDAAAFPASDQFRYRLVDVDGDASGEATVRVTTRNQLTASNDPNGYDPANPFGSYYQLVAGASVVIRVLDNDGGFLNSPVSVTLASAPAAGTAVVNANNTITYTAPGDFAGPVNISYTLTDADGSTSTADVGVVVFPAPVTDTGGSALDLPALLALVSGVAVRLRRRARAGR